MANLARTLNQILVDHIRTLLPSLRNKMEEAIAARQRELRLYGDAPPGNTNAARCGAPVCWAVPGSRETGEEFMSWRLHEGIMHRLVCDTQ